MSGLNTVLKMTSYIANTVTDPKTKLQALSLMSEVFKIRIDLATNSVIVRNAMDFVSTRIEKLKLESESESGSKESEEPDYGEEEELEEKQEKDTGELEENEEKTTNDIF
jgi:hypothetical protein